MTDLKTTFNNWFETTLSSDFGPTALTAQLVDASDLTSPCYLVFESEVSGQREVVLFNSTFTASSVSTSNIANRYLAGSAAASGLTHPAGSTVRMMPLAQAMGDIHDRIDADAVIAGNHIADLANPHAVTLAALGGASVASLVARVPTGVVWLWFTPTAPSGFLVLDGTDRSRTTYADLFALWGTTFGVGDGSTTFGTPDTRQAMPMGLAASGTGSTLPETGGSIDHTHSGPSHVHTMGLHAHSLPAHNHGMKSHTHDHNHPSTSSSGSSVTNTQGSAAGGSSGPSDGTAGVDHVHNMAHNHQVDLAVITSGAPSDNITNDTNPGPTNNADAGNTNAAGTAATGSNNQKYFTTVFIVKT